VREGKSGGKGGGEAEEEEEEEDHHPGEILWDPHNRLFCHFSVSFKQTRFIGGKCWQLFSTLSFFFWGYSLSLISKIQHLMLKSLKSCNLSFGTNTTILVYTSSLLLLLLLLAAAAKSS